MTTRLRNWPLPQGNGRKSASTDRVVGAVAPETGFIPSKDTLPGFEDTDEVAAFIEVCDREVFAVSPDDDCIPKLRDDFTASLNESSGELTRWSE